MGSRLKTLNLYCAICDKPHSFGSMILPTVCERPLCSFGFATFGKRIVGAEGLNTHSGILDLLVATTTLAANSARAVDIFDPFPAVHKAAGSQELALDPTHKKAHLALARQILSTYPSFEFINAKMLDCDVNGLKKMMDLAHELGYPLLEWIRTSNRAHLASVPVRLQLARLSTKHQFVMISAPPDRQEKFDELKAKYGTTFVWHGSAPENWHGILRYGLKNASGTKLMTAGAAFGAGIYLSPQGSLSMKYSQIHPQLQHQPAPQAGTQHTLCNVFLSSAQLTLLALCEVAKVPTLRKHAEIWVAPDEESVVTRFLFAFPKGIQFQDASSSLNSQTPEFEREVRCCLSSLASIAGAYE